MDDPDVAQPVPAMGPAVPAPDPADTQAGRNRPEPRETGVGPMAAAGGETGGGVAQRARRPRTTSPRVRWTDRLTTVVITAGGLGVIVCVLGIFIFLASVVRPLFQGARLTARASYPLLSATGPTELLFAEIDEYRAVGTYVLGAGEAVSFAADDGRELSRQRLFPADAAVTAWARPRPGRVAFGFADGSLRVARLGYATAFLGDDAAAALAALAPGARAVHDGGVVERTERGDLRQVRADIAVDPPLLVGEASGPIRLLDYRPGDDAERLAILDAGHSLRVSEVTRSKNLMSGEVTTEASSTLVPYPEDMASHGDPAFLLLATRGDQLFLAWRDGWVVRYDLRDRSAPALVERVDMLAGRPGNLTAFAFMLGEQAILTADSSGEVRAWFLVRPAVPGDLRSAADPGEDRPWEEQPGGDGQVLVAAHAFSTGAAPVSALATSRRDKTLLVGTADGTLSLHHLTSEQELAAEQPSARAIASAQITAKGDGTFVVASDGIATSHDLHNPHPETTFQSLLGRVWYEGASAPGYTWQSSSGTDDFEPKLSLVPLIFGTLKATFYSMLFAVPIALLAAVYTAEFLDRSWRARIKPIIELMASLPSVVLGFIAALVLAPLFESWVLAVLAALALGPLSALGFGYFWQALPPRLTLGVSPRLQFVLLTLVVMLALLAARLLARPIERLVFAGDFPGWLDGRHGSGAPGIAMLAWPLLVVGLIGADRLLLVPALSRRLGPRPRRVTVAIEIAKYAGLVALSLGATVAIAQVGAALGYDPRGELFGTYVQRNALVVGFVMGFAVIPIIYTLAEDALAAVPESLRSASLGCGATRWQTATRVVLPVGLSGIFSALMVGLGRAVGETMIVLMAAGNTPVLTLNLFDGLRTLSANIAVELPEAVKDGTLYRVLFLAALTLFVITFVVNTAAEIVRQRVRKRAYQL